MIDEDVHDELVRFLSGDLSDLKCTVCGTSYGKCDCWVKCQIPGCKWSYRKGQSCRNPLHPPINSNVGNEQMITPEMLCRNGLEHGEQAALFCWAAEYANTIDCRLKLLFAIPNGDQRGDGTKKGAQIAGARLKAEGVKDGVPDLMLPIIGFNPTSFKQFAGLFIEMKRQIHETHKNGGCSDDQLKWHKKLRDQGYYVEVCYGWEQARDTIVNYLNGKLTGYGKDRTTAV